jgi:uncharacterized protein YcfL
MHRTFPTTILSVATLLLVTACNDVRPPSRGRADVTDHRRVFFSQADLPELNDKTAVLSDNVTRDQYGQLSVTVPVRSTSSKPIDVEYQYEFFDGSGKRIEGPLGWTRLTLEPGSPGTIQFVSTVQNAQDYRVTIRRQR